MDQLAGLITMTEEHRMLSQGQGGRVEMIDTSSKDQETDKEKIVPEPFENQESHGDQSKSEMEIEQQISLAERDQGKDEDGGKKGNDGVDRNATMPTEVIKN